MSSFVFFDPRRGAGAPAEIARAADDDVEVIDNTMPFRISQHREAMLLVIAITEATHDMSRPKLSLSAQGPARAVALIGSK